MAQIHPTLPSISSMPMPSSDEKPLFGCWTPGPLVHTLFYGSGCIAKHLLATLPSASDSRVFVVTTNTITWETPLVDDLRQLLGDKLAGIFSHVQQHVPIEGVFDAVDMMIETEEKKLHHHKINVIIALGGGSAIDFAKILSVQACANPSLGPFQVIAIPTTLSAAECNVLGFYMSNNKNQSQNGEEQPREGGRQRQKVVYTKESIKIDAIFYDPEYAQYTPRKLWLSTGITALSHAVETMYDPLAVEFPEKVIAVWAVEVLFETLPKMAEEWPGTRDQMTRLFLAAYASNSLRSAPGNSCHGGLAHFFGSALSSPFEIGYAEISCITLGEVVKFKAKAAPHEAKQIARLLPAITGKKMTSKGKQEDQDTEDAYQVGTSIIALVNQLGLHSSLTKNNVARDEIQAISKVVGAQDGFKEDECWLIAELMEKFF